MVKANIKATAVKRKNVADKTKTTKNTKSKNLVSKTTKLIKSKKCTEKKIWKGWLFGFICVVTLAIIGTAITMLCLNKPKEPDDPTAKLDYSSAFFIVNKDGNYLLWNDKGERVTNDEYQYRTSFVGQHAAVKKNDLYGIIDELGRTTVDFGKYGSISAQGGLYQAEDGNTNEQFLITGDGKVLAKGAELTIDTPSSTSGFATVIVDGKMKIFTLNGALIAEANEIADKEPESNSLQDFGIVNYGDKNWVFDARDGKVIASFDGKKYAFDAVSEDRTMILLDEYEDSVDYKLIANGKVYDLNETKYYGLTANNQVIGYDNYDEVALLDGDYKVARKVSTYIQLKDTDNFAVKKEDGGVAIYRNGQIVKEFGEGASLPAGGILYNDYYAVKEDDVIKFYNLDGSEMFSSEFEDVKVLSNKNHHAIVSKGNNEYYLMDARGNQVGDVVASSISYSEGGYKAEDDKGRKAILDKNGEKVTDFKYTDLYYRSVAKPHIIWTAGRENGKVDVIDVENKKVILEEVEIEDFEQNYFSIKNNNGDIEYYTFDGKLFHTSKDE